LPKGRKQNIAYIVTTNMNPAGEGQVQDSEPWPLDAELIVPIQSTQALINETAAIIGAQVFLKIGRLPYFITEKSNATDISSSGKLPVLRCGSYFVSELEGIVAVAQSKGISLTNHLTSAKKADIGACMSLVKNKLEPALLYFTWIDQVVYDDFTKIRVGSPYRFPLNKLIPWSKRKGVVDQLKLLNWGERTSDEVYREVETCLSALDQYLGDSTFFLGNSPTELDALVFGYLFAILTIPLPNHSQLGNMVRQQRRLNDYCQRMEAKYFTRGAN